MLHLFRTFFIECFWEEERFFTTLSGAVRLPALITIGIYATIRWLCLHSNFQPITLLSGEKMTRISTVPLKSTTLERPSSAYLNFRTFIRNSYYCVGTTSNHTMFNILVENVKNSQEMGTPKTKTMRNTLFRGYGRNEPPSLKYTHRSHSSGMYNNVTSMVLTRDPSFLSYNIFATCVSFS